MSIDLITKHLDIWASAVNYNNGQTRKNNGEPELSGIDKLRELILELAVQGKLVPQDPNDEPASKLLERIDDDKQRQNAGKAKKTTEGLPTDQSDNSSNLPVGWQATSLDNIGYWAVGNGFPKNEQANADGDILFCKVSDMSLPGNSLYINETTNKITNDQAKRLKVNTHPSGTVVFPKIGGAIATNKRRTLIKPTVIDNNVLGLVPWSGISSRYLRLLLESIDMTQYQSGTSIPALSQSKIGQIRIWLPPSTEQDRIVEKVDELMALCDRLEQQTRDQIEAHETLVYTLLDALTRSDDAKELAANWARIADNFDTLFTTESSITSLEHAILDLAIRGHLVDQDPNHESAAQLLERLCLAVADGTAPRKATTMRRDGERPQGPYELPANWEWCRFEDIGLLARGQSKHRPRNDPVLFQNGFMPLVQTGDVADADRTIRSYTYLYNETGVAQSRIWPKGTLCITIAATIGETGILDFEACFPDSVVGFTPSDSRISREYIEYFLRTAQKSLEEYAPATAQKNINLNILQSILIPLPPIEEQHRIVATVDELFSICDKLRAQVTQAEHKQHQFAEATVATSVE
jgi:type I restriction enzyme S subunit